MTEIVYTPILKTKAGESQALKKLDRQVKGDIVPFFDVLALKTGTANGADVSEHLEKQAINIAGAWNGRGPCYVDLLDIAYSARGHRDAHPVSIVYEKLSYERVEVIPVVGIERDISYKLALRKYISMNEANAVAVRLGDEDMQLSSTLIQRIQKLLAELGVANLPLHIFMDFRSIENMPSDIIQLRVNRTLKELRKIFPARIVFAASAMVSDMGKFKRNTLNKLARRDFLLWELIAADNQDVDYADYGIVHPEYSDIDPRLIKPAAKIRYATDQEWLIVKGIKWIKDTSQHQRLAKMLNEKSEFRKRDCWGSERIMFAANGSGPVSKTLEDWVTIDQNTHITYTVRQLSRVKSGKPTLV